MKIIQRLVAALMLLTLTFTVACNKPDDPNNGSNNGNNGSNNGNNGSNNGNNGGGNNNSGIYNGHAFVDLDLPSGTLWATCNVGANSPEDYGDYFAWGETEPKAIYNWETYKYCNGYYYTLTKYCYDSHQGYNGFTDNLTSLEAEDDAATVNWGEGWCMPTVDQWMELLGNTHTTWTTKNGVYGRLFTASNNNSLFLPAAGYYDWSWLHEVGDSGRYWSKSLYINDVNCECAWFFHFSKSDVTRKKGLRYYGWSIRPVRTARQN